MSLSFSLNEQVLVTANRFLVDAAGQRGPECESLIENQHLGWFIVANCQGHILYSTPGAVDVATFFRSSAKPFQALPLVNRGFYRELTVQELALTCASHVASAEHLQIAAGLLQKAGLSEAALQCGPHAPLDAQMSARLLQTGEVPTALFNNCSGKHAGMLYYCFRAGEDPSTYLEPSHPLQVEIRQQIRYWGGVSSDLPLAIDGCGAPIAYLPLLSMARLYAHLGSSAEFLPLRQAMTQYPVLVGGIGRVDTTLMQITEGRLLAKVGADGVLCVARVNQQEGLALKLADGTTDVRDLALVQLLLRLGWLSEREASDPRLKPFLEKKQRRNTQGKTVGEYQLHLPSPQHAVSVD